MARGVAVGVIAIVAAGTFSPPTQSANAHRRRYGLAALAYLSRLPPKGFTPSRPSVSRRCVTELCPRSCRPSSVLSEVLRTSPTVLQH
jgi:hypothetical protein